MGREDIDTMLSDSEKNNSRVFGSSERHGRCESREGDQEDVLSESLSGHVVIFNCNEKVRAIVEELQAGTAQPPLDVLLIVQDRDMWENNPSWHPVLSEKARFITLFGDLFDEEVLAAARVEGARAAIILADPRHDQLADARSTLTAVTIEKQNPQVHTVQELILSINREHLAAMNVDEVVCLGEVSEKLLAQSCITPGVKNIFENILTTEDGTPQIFLPYLPKEMYGRSFRQISTLCVKAGAPFIIMGFIINVPHAGEKVAGGNLMYRSFMVNPRKKGKDIPLADGTQLVVIAYEPPLDLSVYMPIG